LVCPAYSYEIALKTMFKKMIV
jgi:hypothetical protein